MNAQQINRPSFGERCRRAFKLFNIPQSEWDSLGSSFYWEDELATFGRSWFIEWACWKALDLGQLDELISQEIVHEIEARRAISPYNSPRYISEAAEHSDHEYWQKGVEFSIKKRWIEASYRDRQDMTSYGFERYPSHPPH